MSAHALDLFGGRPTSPRPVRHENPIATPAEMKRERMVQALFTCAAPAGLQPAAFLATPRKAVERLLADLGRTPHQVVVRALPATPNDVEIRAEGDPATQGFLLAMAFTGLNIAEAREALASLQAKTPKPKGKW